ncbi:ester cyclase [Streptomyces sp. NPDC018031]|uniref:ester cyclase n=1 Tax=Streptomyces sp. NPDC018031 TaxID=3365033 RepID=UPI00378EFD99
MTTQPTHVDARAATNELFQRAWRQRDASVLDDMAAPDCTYHVPGRPPMDNREFLALMQHIWEAKPDLWVELFDMIVEGNSVACRAQFIGTQTGELLGIPPTGRKVDMEEIILVRWDEQGRLAAMYQEADYVRMLVQLGVMPPPGTGPLGQLAHTFTSAARFTWLKRKARKARTA